MADRIQIRRDTAANWASANPVLAIGEQGYETDTGKMKIGNGSSTWNTLSYFADTASLDATTLDGLDSTDFATAAQGALADSAIQSADLATVATTGSYNDLSDQPSIPSITGLATETYVDTAVSNLVDTAPAALDTLNELAAALGDDADFAGTVTTSLAAKANSADLATVATTGAYSDLTGTPTIPSALTDLSITDGTAGQVLSADGDGTYTFIDAASGGGSGGTASFTSTTDLTAGDLVALSTSGTVSGISTQEQVLYSSPVQPVGAQTKQYDNVSVARISDTKYVVAYRNSTGYPIVYIATVEADNTVTTGTQYSFSTATSSEGMDLFWDPINEIGVVISTTDSQVKYQYFSVTGTTIVYQGITGSGTWANKHHAVYNYETNEIWVAWLGERYSSRYGGLHKAVWNGSAIVITNYALGFTFISEKSYSIRALTSWGTDKVIGQWYDGYSNGYRELVFDTTLETWTAISFTSDPIQDLVYNSTDNIVMAIHYSDSTKWFEYSVSGGVVSKGSFFPAATDVDGNPITWGTNDVVDAKFINGKTYILSQSVYEQAFMYSLERTAQNTYNIELIFDEAVPGSYDMGRMARDSFAVCGSGIVYVEGLSLRKLSFADLSVTNIGDFIGISTETVTANNPAVISIVGGINTNQSGLTPNLKYYATAVGALTTTLTDYPIGIATSATSLLVTESYTSTQKKTDLQLATVATTGAYSDLTGTPTGLATETYVDTAVSNLVDTAPEALNTLNELAAALGDDANFAGTVTTSLAAKANTADLATVATTGAYSDLTGTPTVPADVSDLTDTTSLLGGGGGSFEAVASGSLSDGSTVVLNADGTVSVVAESTVILGTETIINDFRSDASRSLYIPSIGKVIIVYALPMTAVVGTVSGSNISFGTPTLLNIEGVNINEATKFDLVYDVSQSKLVVAYTSSSYIVSVKLGSISGNSISFGSATALNSSNSNLIQGVRITYDANVGKPVVAYGHGQMDVVVLTISGSSVTLGSTTSLTTYTYNVPRGIYFDALNNKIIIMYSGSVSGWQFRAIVGTVSGTSISFGSPTSISNATTSSDGSVFDTNLNKVVAIYRHGSNFYGVARIGTVSGTSISFGTEQIFLSSSFYASHSPGSFDSANNKIVFTGQTNAGSEVFSASISGSDLTFDAPVTFTEASQVHSVAFDTIAEKVVLSYRASGDLYLGVRTFDTTPSPATNLTAENYAGIADAAYADAATATIQTAGSVDDAQSGLTPGQAYYVQPNGTLATTPGTPSVFAGTAVSATSLLIGKEAPAGSVAYADVTGTPDLSSYASTTYVDTAVSNLVDTAPAALDTLNELAAALGDDADFAGTVTTSLAAKANSADLATVATSGSYNDLSDQPTVPADVSDLTDTTSLLGGGGSFEAVASGSLSDGSTVVLNSDGTVSVVNEGAAATSASFGTPTSVGVDTAFYLSSVFDSNSNKVVIAYRDGGNSDYGTAIVGTVSGTSISFGTAVVYHSAATYNSGVTFDSNSNKIVIAFYDDSNSNYGTAIVGTVSGTSISFGTAVVYNNAATFRTSLTFDSNVNKVIIAYRDDGNSSYGTAIVGTVSGTSISFGTPVVFESAFTDDTSAIFDTNTNKVVIAYRDTGNSGYGTAIVGTVSGTSISFGTPVVFANASSSLINGAFDSNSNKVVIAYRNVDNSNYGTAIVGTVSGTSISFGTAVVFESARVNEISVVFDSNVNKVIIAYEDDGNSDAGTLVVGTVSGTSISFDTPVVFANLNINIVTATFDSNSNRVVMAYEDGPASDLKVLVYQPAAPAIPANLTAENYAGIADAAYADGATATIQTAGSVDDAQSGLTPGQAYYVQANGTLGLTPGTPSVFAGTAVSATSLLIGKEAPAATVAYADVTGTPDLSSYASTSYVDTAVSNLVDTAPEALNTLNELAAALNDDADFAGTVTTSLAAKANSADLATVATSGSYNDLSDQPTVPSALTDLSITDGTAGQVLSADGDGTYTFIDAASGGGDPTLGTLTKTFINGESASISLTSSVLVPVVSVVKEVDATVATNNDWDVNSNTENYTRLDTAIFTTLDFTSGGSPFVLGSGSFSAADVGKTIEANSGKFILVATDGSFVETTAPASYDQVAAGSWEMYSVVYNAVDGDLQLSGGLLNAFDISTASYSSKSFSVSAKETSPSGIAFNTDGTKMFIVGYDSDSVHQYALSTGFDISTASFSQSFSVSAQDTVPVGLAFNTDGTKMFVLGGTGDDVNEYTLSTAFDVSTATYSQNISISAEATAHTNMSFSPDGTKMYISATAPVDRLYQYNLSTAFDISTVTYSGIALDTISGSDPRGSGFNLDGTRLFIANTAGNNIISYNLSTGFDLSTATLGPILSVSSSGGSPMGLSFNNTGSKMLITSLTGSSVYEYSIGSTLIPTGYNAVHTTSSTNSSNWLDINTMTADDAAGDGSVYYAISTDDRASWTVIDNTLGERDIVRNNSGTWQYNSNGAYASETWVNGATNTELATLAEAMEGAAFIDPATGFDISTSNYDSVSFSVVSQDLLPSGIAFNTDGTKMFILGSNTNNVFEYNLSTAYDVSTSSFVDSFNISQDLYPYGLAFNPDGTKMYIMGLDYDKIYQYTLSTGFDISTASYASIGFSTGSQDNTPLGIAFNADGTKMFMVGSQNDSVYEYNLSTAYNVSTSSFVDSLSVASETSNPQDLKFDSSGTRLFIIENTNNKNVFEYSLSTAFDISTAVYSSISFSVANEEPSARAFTFNASGTKMFVVGHQYRTVYEYAVGSLAYTNQMDKTQLNAVTDPNHIALGDDLDLAIIFNMTSGGTTLPSSDGVSINYDANVTFKGAVLGTDYDFEAPTGDSVTITALAANNLKVRVV